MDSDDSDFPHPAATANVVLGRKGDCIVGKPLGPEPSLALLGDGFFLAGLALWANGSGSYELANWAHQKLNSERLQAWLAKRLGIACDPGDPDDESRLLSQSLEAAVGRLVLEQGTEAAIDWVTGSLKKYLPDNVAAYLRDRNGDSIAGREWIYTLAFRGSYNLWQACKGQAEGFGRSKAEARNGAIFRFYFGN